MKLKIFMLIALLSPVSLTHADKTTTPADTKTPAETPVGKDSDRVCEKRINAFKSALQAVIDGKTVPSDPEDLVAKEMLKDFFSKHFEAYSRSVSRLMLLPERSLIVPDIDNLHQQKPHIMIKKMGKYMLRDSINYIPILRAA